VKKLDQMEFVTDDSSNSLVDVATDSLTDVSFDSLTNVPNDVPTDFPTDATAVADESLQADATANSSNVPIDVPDLIGGEPH
jgi:hypothetical protein